MLTAFLKNIFKEIDMLTQRLSKQTKLLCLSAFIALALPTADVLANRTTTLQYGAAAHAANNLPKVCVFDLDETLIKDGSFDLKDVYPQAADSIKKCVDAKFKIAFLTARTDAFDVNKNVPWLFFLDGKTEKGKVVLDQKQFDEIASNAVSGPYMAVQSLLPDGKRVNPIYVSFSRFSQLKFVDSKYVGSVKVYNKGDGMNRLMRTFYGVGVGEGDVTDTNNEYVKTHPNPNKYGVSGCMVLFDDDSANEADVKAFNDKHRLNFQTMVAGPGGVLTTQVDEGIQKVADNCGNEAPQSAYRK